VKAVAMNVDIICVEHSVLSTAFIDRGVYGYGVYGYSVYGQRRFLDNGIFLTTVYSGTTVLI
jgi:hypothetical protein